MIISKIFKFESAHKLEAHSGKCKNLHGHTWKLIVSCSGEVDKKTGMIVDFKEIERIVNNKVIEKLDHSYLNDFIKNPTCENILFWIKNQLKNEQKMELKRLTLYEEDNSFCEIEC